MLSQRYAIEHIESYIQPLLLNVLKSSKLPICKCESIEINCISSSCGQSKGDRFKLSIPYAKYNVAWTVLFDSQCPEMGPDFIFHDKNFLEDIDVDTISTQIPSLANWDCSDENALLNVLVELLICYKQYQVQLLQKDSQLQNDYENLIQSKIVQPENIEMLFLPFNSKASEARFLITLPINMFDIQYPIEVPKNNIKILLTYTRAQWTKTVVQLCLPDSLESAFDGSLHPPYFSCEETMLHYVNCIRKLIQEKIHSIAQRFNKRLEFFLAVMNDFCILEYDSQNCTYITCMEEDKFLVVVHIKLSLRFPDEQPIITLQSPYLMQSEDEVWSLTLPTFDISTKNAIELCVGIKREILKHIHAFHARGHKLCIKQ